jgi:predicted nucleic acid-binding protein
VQLQDREALLRELLMSLWKVHPSRALFERALQVQRKQGFGFYDSLIVAAALGAGCRRLLTEDLPHGQRIGTLRIENPFLA